MHGPRRPTLCGTQSRPFWKIRPTEKMTFSKKPANQTEHERKIMKKIFLTLLIVCSISGFAEAKMVTKPSGLKYNDEKVGTGAEAQKGKKVSVHYTGWLNNNNQKGKKFDSSLDHGQAFQFPLGAGRVIPGWDEGVVGMKIGGKRTLYIPSKLAYGEQGAGGAIPPNSNLIFDVELLDVK